MRGLRLLAAIGRVLRPVLRYALPPRCPGCGTVVPEDGRFCLRCWLSLDFLAGAACAICLEPFADAGMAGLTCGACLADPPPFDRVHAAVGYGPVARAVVMKLKHGNRPGQARTIALAMTRLLAALPADAVLVPVPLHRWRIWRRGYNQSALIAQALAETGGFALAPDLLVRTRRTPMLGGLGRAARQKAVRGAFALAPGAAVRGRAVVLIDDVFTTGATARACARVLKRGGATRIDVLCWARVAPDHRAAEAGGPG